MEFEVKSNIKEIEKELDQKLRNTLNALGLTAERHAKENAPVGTPESTGIDYYVGGNLRNSITYVVDEQEKAVIIGTDVEYGKYQEFGTSKGIKAKHFLRDSITKNADEYKAIIEAGLK